MKIIKSCPITKCEFKVNTTCSKFNNVNECNKCLSYRKKQSKLSKKMVRKYKVYRQAGCNL